MKQPHTLKVLGAIFLFICSNLTLSAQELAKPKPVLELSGVKWMLVQVDGIVVPDGPRQPWIMFHKKEGTAGGHSGCNSYWGKYETEGEKLTLTDSMTNLMGCDPEGKTEAALYQNLAKVNRHKIDDGELLLYKDYHLLLVFEPEKKKSTR